MAVSGPKSSEFRDSVSLGSAEDFDYNCEPCNTIGQHVEAYEFCVDCQEYLCKNCFECHKRTKASRNHKLIDKDNFGKQVVTSRCSEGCIEKCSVHKTEVVKFYCPTHEALCCCDCIIMEHRTCNIDYIPHKCADIGEGEEFKDIMMKLNQKMEEVNEVQKYAENREKEIEKCHASIIQEIRTFRKEINDRLDQMQQQILQKADKKKSDDLLIIQAVLDECASIISGLKKMQSSLQTNKASQHNGLLYIDIKKALGKLKSDEVNVAEEKLAQTNKQYSYDRNAYTVKILSKNNIFGKLKLSLSLATPMQKKLSDLFTHKEDIDIRTRSDMSERDCCIRGCAVLSSNKIGLADSKNKKVKIVDMKSKTVTEEKPLESEPWDIAVMPRDKIAVTFPYKNKIYVMTTGNHLSVVHKIPANGYCYGITYRQGYLYVVCRNPKRVHVLDTQGNFKNTILLNNDIFNDPQYIVLSEDAKVIYISDWGSDSVISITLQGDVSAVYKHKDLSGTKGMLMLDDGSLLVCCYWNGTIHHITGDLKQGQTMIDNLHKPQSICYSHHHDEVYIGCFESDQLNVFSMKQPGGTNKQ